MVCLTIHTFPKSFPFSFPPLIGGAGIAGRPCLFPFRDVSGIAGKRETLLSGARG
jgi:hypothetical protein